MANRWIKIGAMALVLAVAGGLRFHDLGHAAVRSDEINFLNYVERNQSLVDLWKTPPWFNQIPLADSVPIVWARLTRQAADEAAIRQPFALLGWLTVAFVAIWATRRRGIGAGLLLGAWMAVLPYHVYHSREAYYYVLVMCFAAGTSLRGADFAARARAGGGLRFRDYVEWTGWAMLVCLSHMSAWAVAGVVWLVLLLAGLAGLRAAARRRHAVAMACVALAMGGGLVRWILRALHEMQRAAANPEAHVGSAFGWIGPRVLPFFMGGANAVGIGLLAVVLAAAAAVWWRDRGKPRERDRLHDTLGWLAFGGLAGSYAYIVAVGGGEKAKLTYFAANAPAVLAWSALALDRAFARAGERRRAVLDAVAAALVAALLALPAWKVTQLDGKPAAYRQIRAWLDEHLAPGDVAIVDRWLEPWNEMARYAPTNASVSFTVPDEPYEQYMGMDWRRTTKELFERNGAQAFIRLQRNHEKRIGLWTWPETWFRRRAVVENEAGVWLRDTGFAPMEEYYAETNRVRTEIFYDTHDDVAERARAAGRDAVWFFGEGWRLFKPWQGMPGWSEQQTQIFWIQAGVFAAGGRMLDSIQQINQMSQSEAIRHLEQGRWADCRVLEREASVTVYNLRAQPLRARGEVVAAASGGAATLRIGTLPPLAFAEGQLVRRTFEVDLPPGPAELAWSLLGRSGALLVLDLRFSAAE